MHVLFVPSWYPADATDFSGSFFIEQAQALAMAGHDVGVISVKGVPVYSPAQLRGRTPGIRLSVESEIRTYRMDKVLPFPKVPGGNERVLLHAWRVLLTRYISENGRPDVLHAHAMFPAGVVTHALSDEFKIPFVVTEHRPSSMDRLNQKWNGVNGRRAALAASALVAVARGFAAELNDAYNIGQDKWQYVPGLLSPQFQDIPTRQIPDGPFIFGHVSHLDPGKRVDMLIEAFAEQFHNVDGVRLRIAGDSIHKAELETLAGSRGVGDKVDFVGAVQRKDIVAEFSSAHVFVLASVAEAFGTVLWEAMACGLPVVSTATWAGKNAVGEANGLLSAIDNREELGQALVTIRENFNSYVPEDIRAICVDHCGREAFTSQYEMLYTNAVQASRR
ncbi:Glycosyltransferase involved in cell wall bisynthesis [Arthrobacter alpinus]|uniref:Glycosyltransferase involved in cell wall bisynthesis n=1 Tax=Arthrobacter alpinus TaxID=656366 RepID=A0A1H5E8T8_9MICC|nr:glycosyltransferase [Arthrobacter alpinus]SED87561.1 Glycosyltransferase involved in cell wall bisynthesis [Arthrobacter alpinus]